MSLHTANFEQFLKQYKSTGKMHLDGYSPSDFEGLTEAEQAQAFQLLEKSLFESNDATAIYGLSKLNAKQAMPVFERFYEKIQGPHETQFPELFYWMYCITADEEYLQKLLQCLNAQTWPARQAAIVRLTDLPVSEHTKDIYSSFRARLFVELDSTVTHSIASRILNLRGLKRGDAEWLPYIRQLTSESADDKKRALEKLETSHALRTA